MVRYNPQSSQGQPDGQGQVKGQAQGQGNFPQPQQTQFGQAGGNSPMGGQPPRPMPSPSPVTHTPPVQQQQPQFGQPQHPGNMAGMAGMGGMTPQTPPQPQQVPQPQHPGNMAGMGGMVPQTPTQSQQVPQPQGPQVPHGFHTQQQIPTPGSMTPGYGNDINSNAGFGYPTTTPGGTQQRMGLGEEIFSLPGGMEAEIKKLPKRLLKGIDVHNITPAQLEILKKKAKKARTIRNVFISILSAILVLSTGVFAYLYLVNPPLEKVNEEATNGYALKEWSGRINSKNFEGAAGGNSVSYLGLEYNYATDSEELQKVLDLVYAEVRYEVPLVTQKTIWGKDALDKDGKPIMVLGELPEGTEVGVTLPDWDKIQFSAEDVEKAKTELGLDPTTNPLPEEDNKTLFIHLLHQKLTTNQDASNLIEGDEGQSGGDVAHSGNQGGTDKGTEKVAEKDSSKGTEASTPAETQADKGQSSDKGTGDEAQSEPKGYEVKGFDSPETKNESMSENGFVHLKTVGRVPSITFSQEAGKYLINQEEDIFLDNLLFASKDFNSMVYRFQKTLAGENELVTKEWLDWNNLAKTQKEATPEPEPFNRLYSLPKVFIGAYQMQHPDGDGKDKTVLIPKVGKGTKEDPASLETPVATVVKVVKKDDKGKETTINHPILVSLKSYRESDDALNWFESKDIRNRGLTTNSRMKYFGYEIEITNVGKEPITVTDNTDLVDVNINSLGRTGTIYGLRDSVTLEPGQRQTIETWGMTTSPQRAYLIWGKSFQRELEPVWFRVLSGDPDKAKDQPEGTDPAEKQESGGVADTSGGQDTEKVTDKGANPDGQDNQQSETKK